MIGRVGSLAVVVVATAVTGCTDPYYVSLGGNAAELERDAGVGTSCSSDPVTFVPGSCGARAPMIDRCETTSAILELVGDCAARAHVTCPPPAVATSGSLERDALEDLLTAILRSCQVTPNALRVRFTDGCATRYALDLGQGDAGRSVGDCVAARLGTERYDCARSIECGVGELFGVPTSSVEPGCCVSRRLAVRQAFVALRARPRAGILTP